MNVILNVKKIYNRFIVFLDRSFGKSCEASVADVILQREKIDRNQILSVTRYIDIANFFQNNDESFTNQNTISRAQYGVRHDEKGGNAAFKNLIHSFQLDGYDHSSQFTVDRDCRLLDGNHRMALCLYMEIDSICLRYLQRRSKNTFGTELYTRLGIEESVIQNWLCEYERLNQRLMEKGHCFVANFNDPSLLDEFADFAVCQRFFTVNQDGNRSFVVLFAMKDPKYICKNGVLISRSARDAEKRLSGIAPIVISKNCLQGKQFYDRLSKGGLTPFSYNR